MNLRDRIENDMKAALKAGNAEKLSVLRMLVSAVKTFEIDKKIKAAEDGDVLQIIQKQIKQRKESIDQFEKGNRLDLADKEKKELRILETYMPAQLTESELEGIVKDAISSTGAVAKSEVGIVMKAVLEKARGRADGKTINQLVMKFLK